MTEQTLPPNWTAKLNAALAKAKAEFKPITKNRVARLQGKSKATGKQFDYAYKYADLAQINEAVDPALSAHGLATSSELTKDGLIMYLRHESGEERSSFLPINYALFDKPQELGSVLTYYQRYLKGALLGLATEEDDDGKAAQTDKNPAVASGESRPIVPAPAEEKYSGKPKQKERLMEVLQSAGVTDHERMRELSRSVMATPMSELPIRVRELVKGTKLNGTAPPS